MHSYEVLKRAAEAVGVKALAAKLRLSPALVYKWCQRWDPADPDASGARNPLDRLADVFRETGDLGVVNWLCHEAGGFYVPNPGDPAGSVGEELLVSTQRVVNEFSELLSTVTKSIEDDGAIEPSEAERIRREWEEFKSTVEAFTVACERGKFARKSGSKTKDGV